jgi:MFS family permease
MRNKQLAALFVCNMIVVAHGAGLTGLLPVHATRLGADSALAGFYLASAFFALAVSTIIAGRLSNRFQRRKTMLIISGAAMVPLTWLIGQATTFPMLMLLTALTWFAAGMVVSLINILGGLFAEESQRGRVFGIIGLGGVSGAVLGSLVSGPIADRWDFMALFTLAGLLCALIPLAGFFLEDKVMPAIRQAGTAPSRGVFANRTFLILWCASIVAHLANSQMILIKSLIMDRLEYDSTAISGTGAIGALIVLPIPLLAGWLSDRLGRKPFLMLCYFGTAIGLAIMIIAVDVWHFWVVSALQNVIGASLAVGLALVADIFPRNALGTPLSLFNATPWIGFVIGFSGSGAAINAFQVTPTLMIGVVLALVAVVLLMPIRSRQADVQPLAVSD